MTHQPRNSSLTSRTLALAGVCLGSAALIVGMPAHADVIVSYSFPASTSTSTSSPVSSVHTDVTATDYTAQGGTQIGTTTTHYANLDNISSITTITDAVANNVYGQFSVTVADGSYLDLSSLAFGMRNDRGNDGEVFTVHLRSSLDSYANDIATVTQSGDSAITTVETSESIDLSGAAFQNLAGTTTFRLYMVSNIDESRAQSQFVRISPNVVLNGTIIPEPGSIALAGLGSLMLLPRRRRARIQA